MGQGSVRTERYEALAGLSWVLGGCGVNVTPVAGSIAWVLECGCEPMFEHCDQCDERRRVRAKVEAKRVANALARLAQAEALLDAWCAAAEDGEPLGPLRAQTLGWLG